MEENSFTPDQHEYWFDLAHRFTELAMSIKENGIESFGDDGLRVKHGFNEIIQLEYFKEADRCLKKGIELQTKKLNGEEE
jgi:hypothetical protein